MPMKNIMRYLRTVSFQLINNKEKVFLKMLRRYSVKHFTDMII